VDNGKEQPDGSSDEAPNPSAVTFVTTEHFALQGARAATIAESTGRATMFLTTVSGGLVALGLVAAATRLSTAFYAFGLVLLPALGFVGLVTFERVLQTGVDDLEYAARIARLRTYYFDKAPEVTRYLASEPPQDLARRWAGSGGGPLQSLRTVAGMVSVVIAILAGSAAGLVGALASGHSLAVGLAIGVPIGLFVVVVLVQYQHRVWKQAGKVILFEE
jgi:hypothetical protein